MRTLSDTALVTTTGARAVFARLRGSSPTRALTFALLTELCALGSILAGTVLVLLLLAPRFTRALLGTGSVWLLCSALWLCAAVLVVALHLLWAALLERGIEKRGQPRSTWLAVEFGCYSCGWDLLTSPIGIWLSFEHGKRTGVARTSALLAAFRAPRPAMHAYLEQCRGLDADGARSVLRHAAAEATLVVLLATVLAVSVVLGLLLASWT